MFPIWGMTKSLLGGETETQHPKLFRNYHMFCAILCLFSIFSTCELCQLQKKDSCLFLTGFKTCLKMVLFRWQKQGLRTTVKCCIWGEKINKLFTQNCITAECSSTSSKAEVHWEKAKQASQFWNNSMVVQQLLVRRNASTSRFHPLETDICAPSALKKREGKYYHGIIFI